MNKKVTKDDSSIARRLDAIIRLLIETNKDENVLSDATAARLLKSVGLTPTEIARILGKKSATSVAPYLYGKRNNK
ncbi:MAG: hypothetical protein HY961_10965 [Ignavibacteriae bacterium]|nr:hypothetical protein [Ignavibacteriota bacterium]